MREIRIDLTDDSLKEAIPLVIELVTAIQHASDDRELSDLISPVATDLANNPDLFGGYLVQSARMIAALIGAMASRDGTDPQHALAVIVRRLEHYPGPGRDG